MNVNLKTQIEQTMNKQHRDGTILDLNIVLDKISSDYAKKFVNGYKAFGVAKQSKPALELYANEVRNLLQVSALLMGMYKQLLRDSVQYMTSIDVELMRNGKEPVHMDFLMAKIQLGEKNVKWEDK